MKLKIKFNTKYDKERSNLQNTTADWALDRLKYQNGVLFCDPVGNGKTWEAILTAMNLTERFKYKRILIIAEKSELTDKWKNELDVKLPCLIQEKKLLLKTCPELFTNMKRLTDDGKSSRINNILDCRTKRAMIHFFSKKNIKTRGIWFFSRKALQVYVKVTGGMDCFNHFDLIIFDECHIVRKRSRNRTFEAFLQLRINNPNSKFIGLTATPCGKEIVDLFNLIQTFCLSAQTAFEMNLTPELLELYKKTELWIQGKDEHMKILEKNLFKYLARTPNYRERIYKITSKNSNEILADVIGGLPIPEPFVKVENFSSIRAECEALSDREIRHMILTQTALRVCTNILKEKNKKRYTHTGLYSSMCSGFEPISNYAEKIRNISKDAKYFKFTSRILNEWVENSSTHPKTQRLINMMKNHYTLNETALLNGKILIYSNLLSVVKKPHLYMGQTTRKKARSLLSQKLGKKYVTFYLGDKASSAKFLRVLRILSSALHDGYDEEYFIKILNSLSRQKILELLERGIFEGISFVDACNHHFDDLRNKIAQNALNSKTSIDKKEFIEKLNKSLSSTQRENLRDVFSEDVFYKSNGKYIHLENVFWNNHFMMLEAYKLSKVHNKKFFEIYIELVISVGKILKPKRNYIPHPLFHPSPPYRHMTGSIKGKDRNKLVEEFKLPINPGVLFCTNVGTEGIDLHTFCSDIVHYTLDWTPAELEQKTGRVDRQRDLPNELESLYSKDPRYDKKLKNHSKSNVHFLLLPDTYDERQLFIVNQRAERERSLLANNGFDFNQIEKGKRKKSLNLSPLLRRKK